MKYVRIPGTDLSVSPICLGSTDLGSGLKPPDAFRLLDEFVAMGGNFIDTAHIYADWLPGPKSVSEKTIGQWLRTTGNRDQIVIGTKGGHPDFATMHISRLSPAEITCDVNESLEYLQSDYIDIYWLHRDDRTIPVSEIIDALVGHVQAGEIRYLGCSNWTITRLREALDYSASKGIPSFVANQPMWSLAAPNMDRLPDKTLVAMDEEGMAFHRQTGMAAIPYSSQAKGFFTKVESAGLDATPDTDRRVYYTETNMRRFKQAQALAKKYRAPVNDIALAYLLCQPFATIPIVGCKRLDHLRASLKALDLTLTSQEVETLETA
jgi:aryl-alcohol dehydrogenase-like predicted oxidoreductase